MENNENNVQEQVKKVKKDVPKGNAAKGFVVAALLIVFLGIGFGFGFLCSKGWNPFATKASSKKIDESKPWVYDLEVQGKQVGNYNTADYLKVPYININSDDAKKVNTKIQELYESSEKEFIKEKETNKDATVSLRYEKTENDKYVSIIISKGFGYENGSGSTIEEFAYTFNTETMKLVSLDEIIKDKQYSKENVDKIISKSVDKTKETIKNGPYSEGAQVSFNNDFYVDNNGKIKILVSVKDTAWENKIRNTFIEYSLDANQDEENTNTTKTETTEATETTATTDKKVTQIKDEIINEDQLNSRQMVITGLNSSGEVVWKYTTLKENCPEQSINEGLKLIGTKNGKVYICDWGKLYILDEQNGNVIYSNTEINMGAAAVTAFDDNNNLYTASYLAPLCLFDTEGRIISLTYDLWDNGASHANKITIEGDKLIIDCGDDGIETLNRYSLKMQNPKKEKIIVKECIPSGWAGASNNKIVLYYNGDVDYIGYNGTGETDDCINYRKLIATSATDIEYNKEDGPDVTKKIIIKGQDVSEVFGLAPDWVKFEK